MGEDLRTPKQAVAIYQELVSDGRIEFADEPVDIEALWLSFMPVETASGSTWTDAWRASFSVSHRAKLVSFDAGMRRWEALTPEILSP